MVRASRTTRTKWGPLALIAAGVVLLLFLAVRVLPRSLSQAGESSARGLITDVTAVDIGHAATLQLHTNDGRDLKFKVDPAVDMTPGHLREHMTFGNPVTVVYRRVGNDLVAVQVTD